MTAEEIRKTLQREFVRTIRKPFVDAVKEYDMVRPGDRVAVCISGGKDSMLLGLLLPGLYVAMAAFHPQMLPTELLHRSSLNIYARSVSQPSSSFWGVPLWRAPHL